MDVYRIRAILRGAGGAMEIKTHPHVWQAENVQSQLNANA
jgi:hypothetical protein